MTRNPPAEVNQEMACPACGDAVPDDVAQHLDWSRVRVVKCENDDCRILRYTAGGEN